MSSFGERLREERERREIPLDEVARETRINVRYLAALESVELQDLPGSTFNKGYLRTYARYLELDPEPLVLAYLEEEKAQREEGQVPSSPDVLAGLRESVARGGRTRGGASRGLPRSVLRVAVPVAMGLLAVAIAAWLAIPHLMPGPEPAPPPEAGAPGVVAGAGPVIVAPPAGAPMQPDSVGEERPTSTPRPAPATGEQPPATAAPAADERVPEAESGAKPAGMTVTQTVDRSLPAITEFGVGTGVEQRRLVGQGTRFEEGTEVWFWTRVTGGARGESIRHLWMHGDEPVGSVTLSLGGPHWRTHSRRVLPPGSTGPWTVEARDEAGRLLARQEFLCVPAGGEDD